MRPAIIFSLICLIGIVLSGCARTTPSTPALPIPLTPEPTPSEASLRALLVINAQLSRGIAQMNRLIETCNQQPEMCQHSELIQRLDAVNSAIGDVLIYADFLQPTPTP